MVQEIADRQTDRQTDVLITTLPALPWAK